MASTGPRPPKTPRYGLRTLSYLTMAMASILSNTVLTAQGNTSFVLLTSAGLLVGLVGAVICTVRGLRSWQWLPRD